MFKDVGYLISLVEIDLQDINLFLPCPFPLSSNEVKNLAAMRRNALQKSYSAPPVKRPDAFSGKASASSSKPIRPPKRLPF
ncbi:hypothetical protein C1H46_042869 [Malus baccata]|uniref:Uncharacterized protein n=1 Tax=Malus baccata TaxID=106549 RepID=A0A540KBK9_MALBA|nr:hypothetical protein C1H46_042869 [Malus baccata]